MLQIERVFHLQAIERVENLLDGLLLRLCRVFQREFLKAIRIYTLSNSFSRLARAC